MGDRSPSDGRPYYCIRCNLGFGEYIACELPDCELESPESAEVRRQLVEAAKARSETDTGEVA